MSLRPAWAGTPAPPPAALALPSALLQGSGRVPAAGADLRHWTGNAESRPGRATAACASSPRRLKPVSPANRSSGSWTQRGPLLLRGQEVTVIRAVARCHWLRAFLFNYDPVCLALLLFPPIRRPSTRVVPDLSTESRPAFLFSDLGTAYAYMPCFLSRVFQKAFKSTPYHLA